MELTLWTYEGPPHVGAIRVATAMQDVHYVLHAPQGDTYADLLFTMIERLPRRPPVTYTTFQARDLGGDTAALFQDAVREAYARHQPKAILVGASCTAELLQDDPGGLCQALDLPVPVIPLELPSYQRKENWGAAETFYQLVRRLAQPPQTPREPQAKKRCNLLGPSALGFRHRDDVKEITALLHSLDIEVSVVAPLGASVADLARIPEADFNVLLYPEVGHTAATWLMRQFGQPYTRTTPIGERGTQAFIAEVCALAQRPLPSTTHAHAHWYTRSVDSTYLTNKRVFIFGDATHAVAAAHVAQHEMGFEVVGLGTYSREFAREVRETAQSLGIEAIISDDHVQVEAAIEALHPDLILGTQMERHTAKRHGIACAVISSPVHVQDFPARYSPQMGFEGANVMFDTWIHPLMMGLEEHLLHMFREDFEFHTGAAPSHLPRSLTANLQTANATPASHASAPEVTTLQTATTWSSEAERELGKIPFFVRGKARRNTERYASELGVQTITVETLYDAKAHFSR